MEFFNVGIQNAIFNILLKQDDTHPGDPVYPPDPVVPPNPIYGDFVAQPIIDALCGVEVGI